MSGVGKRYLETEFEDARQRMDFARQRQMLEQQQRRAGKSDCEACVEEFCCGAGIRPSSCSSCCWGPFACCCPSSQCQRRPQRDRLLAEESVSPSGAGETGPLTLLVYSVFPAFAVCDLVLSAAAKQLGLYERSLAEMVLAWSPTAFAFWIALTLLGVGVAACNVVSKCLDCGRRRRIRQQRLKDDKLTSTRTGNNREVPKRYKSAAHLSGEPRDRGGQSKRRAASAPPYLTGRKYRHEAKFREPSIDIVISSP